MLTGLGQVRGVRKIVPLRGHTYNNNNTEIPSLNTLGLITIIGDGPLHQNYQSVLALSIYG